HRELARRNQPELLAEPGRDRSRITAAARLVERLEFERELLREARERRDLSLADRVAVEPDLDLVRQSSELEGRGRRAGTTPVDPDLGLRRLARDLDLAVLRDELDRDAPAAVRLDGKLAGLRLVARFRQRDPVRAARPKAQGHG